MDINEAKSFLIVMGFLCFITTSISFYNFTKNKQFLRSQINHDLDDNYYQKEINHDLDLDDNDNNNYYQDDVVVSDIFIHEQLK